MRRDVDATMAAICELHKEWAELVALRNAVRAAPFDAIAEHDLVTRLQSHSQRLSVLRASIVGQTPDNGGAASARPLPGRRSAHSAH